MPEVGGRDCVDMVRRSKHTRFAVDADCSLQ